MEKFISVIVPFRNARENLEECVQSLLCQNYPKDRHEIIMVDNASVDGGYSVLENYRDRIILVREEKIGEGPARNAGIAIAKGEIIATTDSDCVIDSNWLRYLVAPFKSETVVAVAGEIKAYRPITDIEIFYEGLMRQEKNLSYAHPYAVNANVAYRKSIFKEIGGFDSGYSCADVDFSYRVQDKGYRIIYEPRAIVYHKNIKTAIGLFKKITLMAIYAPKVAKKNLKFLERRKKVSRINTTHYKKLIINIFKFIFAKQDSEARRKLQLETIFLLARKLGLLIGSIRFGFIYL